MNRITVPWAEVHDDESPREYSFGAESASATLIVDVLSDNLPVFLYQVLGYSRRLSTGVLTRWLPARHPAWPWMRATRISRCVGRKILSYVQSSLGEIVEAFVPIARYKWERCTIAFETAPFTLKDDSEISSEFDRFVTKQLQPNARTLVAPQGSFYFAEGPGQNTPFPQGVGQIIPEYDIQYTWHQIPEDALFSGGVPTNISNTLGKVNSVAFDNYGAEQLLLVGARTTPQMAPVQPVVMGLAPLAVPRVYQVDYFCKYSVYGHNKVPYRSDNQWYLVTHNGDPVNGRRLYQSASFGALFQPL